MERLSKNFTLDELTASTTALNRRIDNTPTEEVRDRLARLTQKVLQPIRDAWGGSIFVSSGYRCPELNAAVGGSKTSQHMYGEAADIKVGNKEQNRKLFNLIQKLIQQNKIEVGQLIDEFNYSWCHLSLPRTDKPNNQILHLR